MAKLILTFNTDTTAQNIRNLLSFSGKRLSNFIAGLASLKNVNCSALLSNGNAVAASGTITITNANLAENDTVSIGDATFTAMAAGAIDSEFNIGGTATVTATNLAAAINTMAATELEGKISASSNAGVVTVRAADVGKLGNLITLSKVEATPNAFTLSGTVLTGGVDESAVAVNYQSF